MRRIFVLRHGESEYNEQGLLCGHHDPPMTEKGEKQVATTARRMKRAGIVFDAIYSSPLVRAYRSAEIVADVTNGPAPVTWESLRERAYGVMEGKPWQDIEKLPKGNVLRTETAVHILDARGAETFPQLEVRAQIVLGNVGLRHQWGDILLACHGTLGRMLYSAYYELNWKQALGQLRMGNAEVVELSTKADPDDPFVFRPRKRVRKKAEKETS